jgi:hypothetical protein
MRFDEWRFSAKLALQDRFVRWTTIGTAFFYFGMTGFVLWKLIPIGFQSGVLTFHYNIYLGIDDVRPWLWIFLPIGIMLCIFLVDMAFSFGIYRQDELGARALSGLAAAVCIVWAIGLFFLTRVNL